MTAHTYTLEAVAASVPAFEVIHRVDLRKLAAGILDELLNEAFDVMDKGNAWAYAFGWYQTIDGDGVQVAVRVDEEETITYIIGGMLHKSVETVRIAEDYRRAARLLAAYLMAGD